MGGYSPVGTKPENNTRPSVQAERKTSFELRSSISGPLRRRREKTYSVIGNDPQRPSV